jgi:hypothetical protein
MRYTPVGTGNPKDVIRYTIIGVVAANKPGSRATDALRPFPNQQIQELGTIHRYECQGKFSLASCPQFCARDPGVCILPPDGKTDEQRQQLTPYRVFGAMKITIGTLFASGNAADPRL